MKGPADKLLTSMRRKLGVSETYSKTRVGVFFGEPGKTVPDPYSAVMAPTRAGCIQCGSCMVGCRHNAKEHVMKNYLWFAERNGVQIMPERTVADVRPLGAEDGSDGYAVTSERSGAWFRKDRPHAHRARRGGGRRPARNHQLCGRCKDEGALRGSRTGSGISCARTARRSPP